MKKRFHFKKLFGTKGIILAAVSLILVVITAVGATASWIEEVSQVEFSSTDGQETPLHVGDKVLKSDVVMKQSPTTETVSLSDYFYKSGDMHLSPCYSDGDNFVFPVDKNGGSGYRTGTKDDANVNYLSATFRVRSEGAGTAYWFEKSGSNTPFITFKNGDTASTNTALTQYLRLSVTVDGATNVYALNSDGKFHIVTNNTVTEKNGRIFDQYTYYNEEFNQTNPEGYYKDDVNITNKPNQGNGSNLNGNTLFTVNRYDATNRSGLKNVTVKIWLEYNGQNTASVNVASININFVSSWAKTRRVYVKDATVEQEGYDSAKWLPSYSAHLYFGVKDNLANAHYELTPISGTNYYYADIPAVYNNAPAVLFRSSENGWNDGNVTYTGGSTNIKCWNYWETTFPDTFHSEVYTVYSEQFATWEPASEVHAVYFTNSAFFSNIYDYMWDSHSVHGTGINDKVVKNAEWPGLKMTTKMKTKTKSQSLDTYAFFYNSDYDRIIFNDGDYVEGFNQEYQTQDLYLTNSSGSPLNIVNGTFDMATLTWFHTNPSASDWSTKMPKYTDSQTYIYGNFSTNNQWKKTRLAYGGEYSGTSGDDFNGSSSTHLLCKIYCKAGNDYEFKLLYNNTWYGAYHDGDKRVTPNSNYYIDGTLIPNNYGLVNDNNHQDNFIVKGINAGDILRIYFDTNEMKLYFAKGENTHY